MAEFNNAKMVLRSPTTPDLLLDVLSNGAYHSIPVIPMDLAGSPSGIQESSAVLASIDTHITSLLSLVGTVIGQQNSPVPTSAIVFAGRTDITTITTLGVLAIPGVLGIDADSRPAVSSGYLTTRSVFYGYNGSSFDRMRAGVADGTTRVGHATVQPMMSDGAGTPNYAQLRGDSTNGLWVQVKSAPSRKTFPNTPTAFTATTSVATFLAADATYGLDLTDIVFENTSATATEVVIYYDDGTTEFKRFYVPAGDTRGIAIPQGREWTQGAINTAWKAKTVTSVSSVYISCTYIKNTSWSI